MPIINTTKIVRDILGKKSGLFLVGEESVFGSWCAHIFYSGRKQYLMVTNENTLLTVVLPAKELLRLGEVLSNSVGELLQTYGVDKPINVKFVQPCDVIQFSRNTNRQQWNY